MRSRFSIQSAHGTGSKFISKSRKTVVTTELEALREHYLKWLSTRYEIPWPVRMDQVNKRPNVISEAKGLHMAGYRYTPARSTDRSPSASPEPPRLFGQTLSSEPDSSGYEEHPYNQGDPNMPSNAMFYDPNSPFFGMDPQLVGFFQKHNVVMDDGAVVNVNAMKEKAAFERKPKKTFQPPFGLSRKQFILFVVLLAIILVMVVIALVLGLYFGLRYMKPSYPQAQPWWRRTLFYQINVATWANDVGGPTGRLADVIPRMTYLSVQIGATSAILTDLISSDVNGILDWTQVSAQIASPDEAITTLIPQLAERAKQPRGTLQKAKPIELLLGLPLYATSNRHPWFEKSKLASLTSYSTYYLWTTQAPATAQENRYFAYDSTRKAYYRHVHGNPNSPLLNLTNPDVQNELKKAVQFWMDKLNINGIMITNSTNVITEMILSVQQILGSFTNEKFVWFADNPTADAVLNPRNKVCFCDIRINRHVPTRTDDLIAQITQVMNSTRFTTCSPIWRVQLLLDNTKDFETVQRLAYFLPGSFFMISGQEVDLTTGNTELMQWGWSRFNDFSTYYPKNINLVHEGLDRLIGWKSYWTAASQNSLLGTAISAGTVVIIQGRQNEDILSLYRQYTETGDRVYFVVSFQTLNTMVPFQHIFYDLQSPKVEVVYDTKNMYYGTHHFGTTMLVNNQVILLYYY